jgi:hypothetical protein
MKSLSILLTFLLTSIISVAQVKTDKAVFKEYETRLLSKLNFERCSFY